MPEPQRQLPPAAIAALTSGHKIEAIKILRKEWNLDLKASKDYIDDFVRTQPSLAAMETRTASGLRFVWGIVLLALLAGIYFFFRRPE